MVTWLREGTGGKGHHGAQETFQVTGSFIILIMRMVSQAYGYANMYQGNGNPLQCSCLEDPRDGGAWWAAIHDAIDHTGKDKEEVKILLINLLGS